MPLNYLNYYCETVISPLSDVSKKLKISLSYNEPVTPENVDIKYSIGWPDVLFNRDLLQYYKGNAKSYYAGYCSYMRTISAIYKTNMSEVCIWEYDTNIENKRLAEIADNIAFSCALQSFLGGNIFTTSFFENRPGNYFNEFEIISHTTKKINNTLFVKGNLISMKNLVLEEKSPV